MSDTIEVRMVRLEPLRMAGASGFGAHPENEAWGKLLSWAKLSRLTDLSTHRFFGYNNPNPSPGSPNYGYDQWMTVGPEIEEGGDISIKTFAGGLYAVTRCTGVQTIGNTWERLVSWFQDSGYEKGSHQWLEEVLNPTFSLQEQLEEVVFDLYLPIAE